ncbi:MAG: glycosyltransferase family 4 protein [Luteibacter sp.]
MKPLRIWLPTVRSGSGSEVFTLRLAEGLRRAGHDPVPQWLDSRFEVFPWLARDLPIPPGTDVIHSGSIQGFALSGRGLPVVVTEHQYVSHPAFQPYNTGLRGIYKRLLIERYCVRTYAAATRLVAVSQHCAAAMHEGLGVRPEVVHNWVDGSRFQSGYATRPEGPFRLLFVGNPSLWKGSDLLAPLAKLLGPAFEIGVIGGLRGKYSRDKTAPPSLRVLPSRPPGAMPEAYRWADAVLVLSRYDSFGYVALEAMASARPVIGFDNTGAAEVCVNGETALLVSTDDLEALASSCRRLAMDPGLCRRLGEAGRLRSELVFSEADAITRYASIYDAAIAAHREAQ